jgi:hypothetical protein
VSCVPSNLVKIALSIVVSLVAGYLVLRGVQLEEVFAGIHRANLFSLGLVLVCHASAQVIRSLRWALLLEPVHPLSQRLLLPITCIGFLFIWILPARLGEMARPYLLNQNSRVGLSAAMGSVVLERLMDAGILLVLLALCLPSLPVPDWLHASLQGFTFVLLAVAVVLLVGSLRRVRGRVLHSVVRFLPERLTSVLTDLLETFYSGMKAVGSLPRLLSVLALSLVLWGMCTVANLVLFRAMGLELGWLAAFTVLALTCLGIALPAAPGFIGNYHYACVVALTLLGVLKEEAVAFAILIHFLVALVVVLMGVSFMNASRLNLGFPLRHRESVKEK